MFKNTNEISSKMKNVIDIRQFLYINTRSLCIFAYLNSPKQCDIHTSLVTIATKRPIHHIVNSKEAGAGKN